MIAQNLQFLASKFRAAGWDFPLTSASKRGTPLRNRYFTTISSSSVRTIVNSHRRGAYHNKHCWRAFPEGAGGRYQHRWPWTTLNPKIGGFSEFIAYFWQRHTFQKWTATKSLQIDQNNLRMISINVDFNSVPFDPVGLRSRGHQMWVPHQNARFLLLSTNLAWERLQIDSDLLLIITSTADELCGSTNIDDLFTWTPKTWFSADFFLRF